MKFTKIAIKGDFAHFKKPFSGKVQQTYLVPPPSTVIGILKNIFNENINNFVFGYIFQAEEEIFRDLQTIYKEVNLNSKYNEDRRFNEFGKWTTDVCEIQYLYNPRLIIYTDIEEEMSLKEPLVLGKTDCLARIEELSNADLLDFRNTAYNQYTDINTGYGIIQRITTETKYNPQKGIFDIYTKPLRFNQQFEYSNYDEDEEQSIFLWKYRGEGDIVAL